MPHVHVGAIDFVIVALMVVLVQTAERAAEIALHDKAVGRALAFIH